MPAISALLVRLSLLHLLMGSAIGALLMASRGVPFWPWLGLLRAYHYEFLLFGWMVQLAFGVASWILPRVAMRKGRRALVTALVLLNAGILIAATGQSTGTAAPLLLGRLLETGAVGIFAWYIWPRVRTFAG